MMVREHARPARRTFPPRPSSVGRARRMTRELLVGADRGDLVDTAELLVSEIVTNALVHAGTPIEVAVSLVDGGLRIEVTDGSPHVPAPRGYGPSAGTGRGIRLLEEMVDEWGVLPEDSGKTVWCQIGPRPAGPNDGGGESAPRSPHRPEPRGSTVPVALLDVPLLLHEAWRQHAESLLREYLLASIDVDADNDADNDPILVHAQASDAIALLAEQIPPSGLGDDPGQVMVTATEPLVTSPLIEVAVPVDSVPHFRTLDETMRTAVAMADSGGLLTVPPQPELRALRQWLCREVLVQSDGGAPTAWSAFGPLRSEEPLPAAWDPVPVERSGHAVVAADDANRIAAVSVPALEILGYDAAEELVGRRLVSLVPERYRQAHLAGFTMHFLSGRSTLLDRPVVVPALRRDGTEVEVEMTIRAERTPGGRAVFVAELAVP